MIQSGFANVWVFGFTDYAVTSHGFEPSSGNRGVGTSGLALRLNSLAVLGSWHEALRRRSVDGEYER